VHDFNESTRSKDDLAERPTHTEDAQDPEASRSWQKRRAMELIAPHGGTLVADYFDVGQSRALPWKRRPEASRLLADVARRDCGFDAVVIGEPARAFYGPPFALTFPVLTHYGVGLLGARSRRSCRSRVRGPHLVMTLFGGMSKGERARIQMHVRTAMSALAQDMTRYLGGRPSSSLWSEVSSAHDAKQRHSHRFSHPAILR
jgi:site-specific DNA recombinase